MKIGIAANHGGFELKEHLKVFLKEKGYEVKDFDAFELDNADDYQGMVLPLAKSVAVKEVERGIAVCDSGVGASVAANKVKGARAALINDYFPAHQG